MFNQDLDTAMGVMDEWYNGYRFAEEVDTACRTSHRHPVLYDLDQPKQIPNRTVVPKYR